MFRIGRRRGKGRLDEEAERRQKEEEKLSRGITAWLCAELPLMKEEMKMEDKG